MKIKELSEKLSLEIINIDDDEREITGGYCGDLLSWVMGKAKSGDVWVTIMTNINIIAVASLTDVSCIVLAENVEINPDIIDKASMQGINIYRSPLSEFELCTAISEQIN